MQGLEDSLLSDVALRSTLTGLPGYGYSTVTFGSALASNGILALEKGIFVTRLGRLISVGENATTVPLNLNTADGSEVDVYLHLLRPLPLKGVEGHKITNNLIPRWSWRVVLSFDEQHPEAIEYLYLGKFSKSILSEWSLVPQTIPPLLNLGRPGFLVEELKDLAQSLDRYMKKLGEESADIQLSGENLIQVRNCLKEIRIFALFLNNVMGEIKVHPFIFFEKLQTLYFTVASYQGKEPVFTDLVYQHDRLDRCLLPVLLELTKLLDSSRSSTPMAPFVQSGGVWSVQLKDEMLRANRWFLLVQKPQVSLSVDLSAIKFASLQRLALVHKYFLPGILLSKIDRPVFQHYFGPEIDIYEFRIDEEWGRAVSDKSLAFMNDPKLQDVGLYFYWSLV
jgi:type VI secretion system protein ImpJ